MTNTLTYTVDSEGKITFSNLPEGTNLSTDVAGIILIKHGAQAESVVLNDNFTYLNARIDDVNTNVNQSQTATVSNVNTIVNNAIATYQDIITPTDTSGDIPLSKDTIYSIKPTGKVEFYLPGFIGDEDKGKFYQILVFLELTDSSYVSADDYGLGTENYFYNVKPTFTEGKYNIIYEYDGTDWEVGVIKKGVADVEE